VPEQVAARRDGEGFALKAAQAKNPNRAAFGADSSTA
jgi:hypothetical protein